MNKITVKTIKPIELTDDEVSVHLQTQESEINLLRDRVNVQLDMIENLQLEINALLLETAEHRLSELIDNRIKEKIIDGDIITDHRFNERVYDKMVDMVNEGHFKLLTDFYISDQ